YNFFHGGCEVGLYNPRFDLSSGAPIMRHPIRLACLLFVTSSVSLLWSQEKLDLETMGRIRYEGFRDSKVMELASGLMDSIGERLTGSPNMKRANEWTR